MQISGIMIRQTVNSYKSYAKNTKIEKPAMQADKLEISQDAFELYSEKQDIRIDKVENIKSRIASGSYIINSTDIVDKMIQSAGI